MYDYEKIKDNLSTGYAGQTFVQFEDLLSVHAKAKNISENCPSGMLVLTQRQEDIKLKNSKIWYSKLIEGIFMSVIFKNSGKHDYSSQAVQIAAAAVCESILQLDDKINCCIKWPNDVYVNDKKICSVFSEKILKKDNDSLIISIYINLSDNNEEDSKNLKKTTLFDVFGDEINKESIISNILNRIEIYYDELIETKKLKSSLVIFRNYNCILGKTIGVKIINKKTVRKVEAIDINSFGEIEIIDNNKAKGLLKYGQDIIEWWTDEQAEN